MRTNIWLKTLLAIGVTAVVPAFCSAVVGSCVTESGTLNSFDPAYAMRANDELSQMRQDAQRMAYQASINQPPFRADVDDLNLRLKWLESAQALIAPAQREATCEAARLMESITDGPAADLSSKAIGLAETISADERIAKLEEHASYLQRNLGMPVIFGK